MFSIYDAAYLMIHLSLILKAYDCICDRQTPAIQMGEKLLSESGFTLL